MRIACPSCATEYEVPATRLIPRRMVRCARCGGEWMPELEPETVAAGPEPDVAPVAALTDMAAPPPQATAADRLATTPATVRSRSGLMAAWVLTFAVLTGAVAATVVWRDTILRVWPASGWILSPSGQTAPPPAATHGDKTQ